MYQQQASSAPMMYAGGMMPMSMPMFSAAPPSGYPTHLGVPPAAMGALPEVVDAGGQGMGMPPGANTVYPHPQSMMMPGWGPGPQISQGNMQSTWYPYTQNNPVRNY